MSAMTAKKTPIRYRLNSPGLPEDERQAGQVATNAAMNAAAVMEPLQKNLMGDKATAGALMLATQAEAERVEAGDLTGIEAMLVSQAVSLQTIFASLARKAANQEYLQHYQAHMTLALKAQAQSRATLEALIELKQPRSGATFVRQTNVAHGHQQVNNAVTSDGGPSQAATADAPRNKLLEPQHEQQWMDAGTPSAAGRDDPHLETVGAVHRAKDRRR